MLEIGGVSVWIPDVGPVLEDVRLELEPGQVCAVVGSTGSGASMLTKLVTGDLPAGARVRGRFTPLARVLRIADTHLPSLTVAEYVGLDVTDVARTAHEAGLDDQLARPADSLPPDLRTALHLVRLRHAPQTDWVVLDTTLRSTSRRQRQAVLDAVRRRAQGGAGILWADHDLDSLWQIADRVLEVHDCRIRQDQPAATWQPSTVVEPALMTLARLLRLPVAQCRTAAATHQLLTGGGNETTEFVARRPHTAMTTASRTIAAAALGLRGADLVVRADESLALVSTTGRAESHARRLIEALDGSVVPSRLPARSQARTWALAWERAHRLEPGSVLEASGLAPGTRTLERYSSGERARLRAAQAAAPERPVWFPHPQVGLDARSANALARSLMGPNPAPRVVTSHDVDFLVRACREVVIIDGDEIVACGTARAVADLLPEAPLVASATGNPHMQRLTDLIDPRETL